MNPILLVLAVPFLAAGAWGFVYVAKHPVWAAYVFLATQPFVGGIDRGTFDPAPAAERIHPTGAHRGRALRRRGARRARRTVERAHHAASTARS